MYKKYLLLIFIFDIYELYIEYKHTNYSDNFVADMKILQNLIEKTYEEIEVLTLDHFSSEALDAINEIVDLLDEGKLRIAEKIKKSWRLNIWLKKAIHLYYFFHDQESLDEGGNEHTTKMPLKTKLDLKHHFIHSQQIFSTSAIRKGAYIDLNTILMPSYINIGAYVDSGTMIDTSAKIGACAQIGKNVHISGDSSIGGLITPLECLPTIIEDNCYIGPHTEILDGVMIEEGCIITTGVFIDQSTRIYDRHTGKIYFGRVPRGSILIPGNLPSRDGKSSVYCAIILKQTDTTNLRNINLTELIKDYRSH